MNWFMQALTNYAAFEGRAQRSEFWFFTLFYIIFLIVASLIDSAIGLPILTIIVMLGLIIPSISVSVRRLHDTGRSGWWYLLSFVPLLGLVLLAFFIFDSQPGNNDYGSNPKEA